MGWGIAAGIVGSSIVSGLLGDKASSKSSKATKKAADASAEATIKSTKMQIDELARQFDYQQSVLQPQIQQQFNAQRAYSDILGIGGNELSTGPSTVPPGTGGVKTVHNYLNAGLESAGWRGRMGKKVAAIKSNAHKMVDGRGAGPRATMPGPGEGYSRSGPFVDPNLDPTRLADVETLSGTVQDNLLAGTDADADPYRNYISGTSLVGPDGLEGDMVRQDIASRSLADGAAGTGVYGDVFKESPGYAFQVEEMNRAIDRKGSAGGPNIGGRAIMEATRRAKGLAAGEYYNWARGRERDLSRLGDAERVDIGRMDNTAYNFQDLEMHEQGRGDMAYQDYLNRRKGDVSRIDAAAANKDQLVGIDQQRQDQAYYNYLNSVGRMAGFGGGPASQAVTSSQRQGGAVAGAYGSQGTRLSNIFQNQGINEANIATNKYGAWNNAIQGGIENYIAVKGLAA